MATVMTSSPNVSVGKTLLTAKNAALSTVQTSVVFDHAALVTVDSTLLAFQVARLATGDLSLSHTTVESPNLFELVCFYAGPGRRFGNDDARNNEAGSQNE
jgi:hypothetical protein